MSGKSISKRLKETRLKSGYSLDELSKITGYAKTTLHRYENDPNAKLTIDKISHLAECLNVSPRFLMGFESEEFNTQDYDFISHFFDESSVGVTYDDNTNIYYVFPEDVLEYDKYWEDDNILKDSSVEKIPIMANEMKILKESIMSFGKYKILEMLQKKKTSQNRDFEDFFKNNKISLIYPKSSNSEKE